MFHLLDLKAENRVISVDLTTATHPPTHSCLAIFEDLVDVAQPLVALVLNLLLHVGHRLLQVLYLVLQSNKRKLSIGSRSGGRGNCFTWWSSVRSLI